MPYSTPASPLQLVIAEDEAIVTLELQHYLSKLGYKVLATAVSGLEALQLVETLRPDLLLTDIVLTGDMLGTELGRLVQERFAIPVVYLTAHTDAETLKRVMATNESGYVTKPFAFSQLDAVIQLATARHARQTQLEKAGREKLHAFTCAAGHDLRDPLHTVNSALELLSMQATERLEEEDQELLKGAQSSIQRMDNLLTDLLTLARVETEALQLSECSANESLLYALDNLSQAITESRAYITQDQLPSLPLRSSQLTQIFQNLIGNSIKYRHPHVSPRIHIGTERGAGEWRVFVKDEGIGFDPAQSERIFTPFTRLATPHRYEGTGIGLAICKQIIEANGGRIWTTSSPGHGAKFEFAIPDRLAGGGLKLQADDDLPETAVDFVP